MTNDQFQARTYGGWRRSRSIGLLGLGPTATLILLGCAVALLLVAAVSLKTLLFVAPPALLAGAASLIRVGGVPIAQLGVQRLRWWRGTTAGHTSYRAEVVLRHTGVLQLPGTLAATELLSAEDGYGGRYGLVRDRHTGFLTATLRVVPASTWLAEPGEVDGWVANWGAWLASLGYLPALRWVTVTVDTAPDPGSTLTGQIAAAIDPAAPRPALHIMDQLVATAPAAAADVDTRVSLTFDPAAFPSRPGTAAEAITEVGRTLPGMESALGACGVAVLARAGAADIAGIVRTAFDPAVRGEVNRLLAAGIGPGAGGAAQLGQRRARRGGGSVGLLPARQRHVGHLGVARGPPPERALRRPGPPGRPGPVRQTRHPAVPAVPRRGSCPAAGKRGPGGGVPQRVLPPHPPRRDRPRRARPRPRPPGRRRGSPRRRSQPARAVRDRHRHRPRAAWAGGGGHGGGGRVVEDPAAADVPQPGRRVHRHPALRHLPPSARPPPPPLTHPP